MLPRPEAWHRHERRLGGLVGAFGILVHGTASAAASADAADASTDATADTADAAAAAAAARAGGPSAAERERVAPLAAAVAARLVGRGGG